MADYEKYPEFLNEVKECKVVKNEGNRKMVEYTVSVIKSFKYNLWMNEKEPTEITWEFASGDIFKSSVGYWKLSGKQGVNNIPISQYLIPNHQFPVNLLRPVFHFHNINPARQSRKVERQDVCAFGNG